jgi:hypothetical protein
VVIFQNDEGMLFEVNGHHLKIFLEPENPPKDLDELIFLILPQIYTTIILFMFRNAKISFSGLDRD